MQRQSEGVRERGREDERKREGAFMRALRGLTMKDNGLKQS